MFHDMITLRPFVPGDQNRILEILTNKTVNQTYMLPDFEKKEDAIPLFARLLTLSQDESRYVRCICLDSRAIGFLNDVEMKTGCIEVGYVIHPDHHGQGCMTEALQAAISELFKIGYHSVIAGAFETNIASIRVMKKCGMKKMEKTDEIEYRGATHRCIYYCKESEKEKN